MFFETQDFAVQVIDVLSLKHSRQKTWYNDKRPFYALSCRPQADGVLIQDDVSHDVTGKTIAYVPAGIIYQRSTRNEEMTVVHFNVHGNSGQQLQVFRPKNFAKYEKLFDELLRIWTNKEIGYTFRSNEYLCRLLFQIEQEYHHDILAPLAERMADMIEQELGNPDFSIAQAADRLKVSGTYLRRCFKEKYNTSPKEYLLQKRIERAILLLHSDYFTIKEISQQCGFENEHYFSTAFKAKTGISPSKYIV